MHLDLIFGKLQQFILSITVFLVFALPLNCKSP